MSPTQSSLQSVNRLARPLALVLSAAILSLGFAQAGLAQLSPDIRVASLAVGEPVQPEQTPKVGMVLCDTRERGSRDAASIYRLADGTFLRITVNTVPYERDYGRITGLALSAAPFGSAACGSFPRPVAHSMKGGPGSGQELSLGESLEKVLATYGDPVTLRTGNDGHDVQLLYQQDPDPTEHYEWTLVFHDGRLTEWSVEAYPVFVESAG